jgi:arylsulfate sulfotransferase
MTVCLLGAFSISGVQILSGCGGSDAANSKTVTSTLLTTSADAAGVGTAITFTAAVSPADAMGVITFKDGTATMGSATIVAGKASLASSKLTVGAHQVTASYKGISIASTSSPVKVTIVASDHASVSGTANPQVAAYGLTLPEPATVSVDFGKDTTYGFSTSPQHFAAGTPVSLYVAGMQASTAYHMRAKVEYDGGVTVADPDHTFTTGAIPTGLLPAFTVTPTSGLTPQPGVELVDTLLGTAPPIPFATDLDGNPIWTYLFPDRQSDSQLYPIKLQANGHFICMIAQNSFTPISAGPTKPTSLNVLREIDLAGNIVRQLTMAQLNTSLAAAGFNITLQLFSHDFVVLPNGHILLIANMLKQYTNVTGFPGVSNVLGDVVVDVDENFKPVWVWNEFDHLDVNRHPMQFPDWTHSNALAYSPDDGNFLISVRHQNWVIKVDYNNGAGTGKILWKLGYQGDFALQGATDPTDWFYAQHDVNFVSSNTTGNFKIALMDNGDDRVFPSGVSCNTAGQPSCLYTTALTMQVDENAKTAAFEFHQSQPASLYSPFAGDTRVQPNGNIEYNLAGVGNDSYVFEVTPTATPQTVWELHIAKENTYRAFRMPSLYPGVQW